MPDVRCPRCGTDLLAEGERYLAAEDDMRYTRVFACSCGPLAVVEGDRVEWYYPQVWLLGR